MTKMTILNCDKTQIATKLKISMKLINWKSHKTKKTDIVIQLKNSNFENTQKLKLCQNLKTQILTKLKHTNCDNTQFQKFTKLFGKNNLTPWQTMRCTLGSLLQSCDVFFLYYYTMIFFFKKRDYLPTYIQNGLGKLLSSMLSEYIF